MYYFIVNPNSRSGAGQKIWNQILRRLNQEKIPHKAWLTEYVGHASKLASEISSLGTSQQPVSLIALGGDGTISEVLTGIQDFDHVIFGYIPTGSGNDFCRSMNLPHDPMKALDVILQKRYIHTMDVPCLHTNGCLHRFGVSTGMGFDAAVCQEVAASPARTYLNRIGLGKLVYLVIALKQLLFLNPVAMDFHLDGKRNYHYKKVFFAAVMNQGYEGGGFLFCPNAKSNDGILDVIIIEGMSKLKILCCLPTAFFGKHTIFKGVHILRCKNIEINSMVPVAAHRDGESGGLLTQIYVSLEKKPLKIILPAALS